MNTLTKLITINVIGASVLGFLTLATQADAPAAQAFPAISAVTDAAGARIANELNRLLARAASVAKPARAARPPSVVITEGNDIVSEEIVVTASRLPAFETMDRALADAGDTSVTPARF